jgi:hypothetical protein
MAEEGEDPDRFTVVAEGGVPWLVGGEHRWPCAEHMSQDIVLIDDIIRFRRAVIMVESGWRISIVWAPGTYSSNYDSFLDDSKFSETPTTVEVLVLGGNTEPCSDVTPDELADMVTQMTTWPSPNRLGPPSWAIEGGSCRPAKPAGGYPDHAPGTTEVPPNGPPEE